MSYELDNQFPDDTRWKYKEVQAKYKELQDKFDRAIIDISIDRSLSAGFYNELKAKYEKLLAFVKKQASGGQCCESCISDEAEDLLKEIGEE